MEGRGNEKAPAFAGHGCSNLFLLSGAGFFVLSALGLSGTPALRAVYQAFLCDGMLEVDSTAFMDYMEKNDLGYIVDYKRYDADVFAGVNRRAVAVFQFHSAVLCRLNKVGCQRYEGDYTRLKQKHAERRARRMAG